MPNPKFDALLDRMKAVHDKKSHDYAAQDNPYSNFEYQAKVSQIFTDPIDITFANMIAVKMARIAELKKGKTPKNESLQDSYLDLANYAAIWASYYQEIENPNSEAIHVLCKVCGHIVHRGPCIHKEGHMGSICGCSL